MKTKIIMGVVTSLALVGIALSDGIGAQASVPDNPNNAVNVGFPRHESNGTFDRRSRTFDFNMIDAVRNTVGTESKEKTTSSTVGTESKEKTTSSTVGTESKEKAASSTVGTESKEKTTSSTVGTESKEKTTSSTAETESKEKTTPIDTSKVDTDSHKTLTRTLRVTVKFAYIYDTDDINAKISSWIAQGDTINKVATDYQTTFNIPFTYEEGTTPQITDFKKDFLNRYSRYVSDKNIPIQLKTINGLQVSFLSGDSWYGEPIKGKLFFNENNPYEIQIAGIGAIPKSDGGDIIFPKGPVINSDGSVTVNPGTNSEIVIKPGTNGDLPNIDEAGNVTIPEGGKVIQMDKVVDVPNGSIVKPDGSIVKPDGSIVKPDGSIVKPDGSIVKPDGSIVKPDGSIVKPDGSIVKPDGSIVKPDGSIVKPNGSTVKPDGSTVKLKKGNYSLNNSKEAKASKGAHVLGNINKNLNTKKVKLLPKTGERKSEYFILGIIILGIFVSICLFRKRKIVK